MFCIRWREQFNSVIIPDGTKSVVFGRKTTNGNFFLKNNRSTETSIVLKRIGTF
jgi:hypothetical protein